MKSGTSYWTHTLIKNHDWRNFFTRDFFSWMVSNRIELSLYVCVYVGGEGDWCEVVSEDNAHAEIEGVCRSDNTWRSTMTAITRCPSLQAGLFERWQHQLRTKMLLRDKMCTSQFFDHAAGPGANTAQNKKNKNYCLLAIFLFLLLSFFAET